MDFNLDNRKVKEAINNLEERLKQTPIIMDAKTGKRINSMDMKIIRLGEKPMTYRQLLNRMKNNPSSVETDIKIFSDERFLTGKGL